jgi:hypothetical protein
MLDSLAPRIPAQRANRTRRNFHAIVPCEACTASGTAFCLLGPDPVVSTSEWWTDTDGRYLLHRNGFPPPPGRISDSARFPRPKSKVKSKTEAWKGNRTKGGRDDQVRQLHWFTHLDLCNGATCSQAHCQHRLVTTLAPRCHDHGWWWWWWWWWVLIV